MDNAGTHALNGENLVELAPRRNCGVTWALPVDDRLDGLVERSNALGAKTNRRELLSAIVCDFDTDGDALLQTVIRYRQKTVAKAALSAPDSDNIIRIRQHGPGPRRTGS